MVRSGSKVGSKYEALDRLDQRRLLPDPARPQRSDGLTPEVGCVLEIVIDGLDRGRRRRGHARRHARRLRARRGRAGSSRIAAGNYGGKLGPFHFHLRKLLA